ncbi:MAG: FecR domain-containing protein [Prevotella sp.]|nr:FecR domain-containing protein [Prevotella sp.]
MTPDKNIILSHIILGEATEEEYQFIKENCSPEELSEILNATDLAERYRLYDSIDEKEAYEKIRALLFQEEEEKTTVVPLTQKHNPIYRTLLRVAAVILLIVAGAGYWWYRDYTKVTPPEIAQDVLAAIQTSRQQGKSEAQVEVLTPSTANALKKGQFSEELVEQLLDRVSGDKTSTMKDGSKESLESENNPLELITTYHDKEFWRTLSDGTLVHMNADSRIIYPDNFGRNSREVFLNGEAYFMVAKDKSRPFIVHTPRGDVKVYGTEFNVNTRARDNSSSQRNCTAVVLVKGSVGVTPTQGNEFMLTPGQQIIIKEESNSPYISTADIRPYVAWNTKKFEFDNYPLDGLMEIIYRWYHIDYVIEDPKINKTLVSGSIRRYDTIEPLLHGISKITGYDIQIKENTIYINY